MLALYWRIAIISVGQPLGETRLSNAARSLPEESEHRKRQVKGPA